MASPAPYAATPSVGKGGQKQADKLAGNVLALGLSAADTLALSGGDTEDDIGNTGLTTSNLEVKKLNGAASADLLLYEGTLAAGTYKVSAQLSYEGITNVDSDLVLRVKDDTTVIAQAKSAAAANGVAGNLVVPPQLVTVTNGAISMTLSCAGTGGTIPVDKLELLLEQVK